VGGDGADGGVFLNSGGDGGTGGGGAGGMGVTGAGNRSTGQPG
jgi:hypothetical protein